MLAIYCHHEQATAKILPTESFNNIPPGPSTYWLKLILVSIPLGVTRLKCVLNAFRLRFWCSYPALGYIVGISAGHVPQCVFKSSFRLNECCFITTTTILHHGQIPQTFLSKKRVGTRSYPALALLNISPTRSSVHGRVSCCFCSRFSRPPCGSNPRT
jgi:hypothetical protein